MDLNYGSFLSIWDQMFGTWYRGKDYEIALGATDNYMNQRSFLYDLWSPFARFWVTLLLPARPELPTEPAQGELASAEQESTEPGTIKPRRRAA